MAHVVVLIDLGANRECSNISPGTKQIIVDGANYAKQYPNCVVVYCNPTNVRGTEMTPERSEVIKSQLLRRLLPITMRTISAPALNTIQEAENIKAAIADKNIPVEKITIVCDSDHVRRLRVVWRYYFPEVEIVFLPKLYVSGRDYAQFLLWSRYTWRFMNIMGVVLMKVLGIKFMGRFGQLSVK